MTVVWPSFFMPDIDFIALNIFHIVIIWYICSVIGLKYGESDTCAFDTPD